MPPRKRLGQLLVELGLIDEHQLQSALGHQKQWGGKLGGILVQKGFCREVDVVEALSKHLALPTVQLSQVPVDPKAVKLVSRQIAEKLHVFAYNIAGAGRAEVVSLAMSDPTDLSAVDQLAFHTGKRIKPVLCGDSEIVAAIEQHYGAEGGAAAPAPAAAPPASRAGPHPVGARAPQAPPAPPPPPQVTAPPAPAQPFVPRGLGRPSAPPDAAPPPSAASSTAAFPRRIEPPSGPQKAPYIPPPPPRVAPPRAKEVQPPAAENPPEDAATPPHGMPVPQSMVGPEAHAAAPTEVELPDEFGDPSEPPPLESNEAAAVDGDTPPEGFESVEAGGPGAEGHAFADAASLDTPGQAEWSEDATGEHREPELAAASDFMPAYVPPQGEEGAEVSDLPADAIFEDAASAPVDAAAGGEGYPEEAGAHEGHGAEADPWQADEGTGLGNEPDAHAGFAHAEPAATSEFGSEAESPAEFDQAEAGASAAEPGQESEVPAEFQAEPDMSAEFTDQGEAPAQYGHPEEELGQSEPDHGGVQASAEPEGSEAPAEWGEAPVEETPTSAEAAEPAEFESAPDAWGDVQDPLAESGAVPLEQDGAQPEPHQEQHDLLAAGEAEPRDASEEAASLEEDIPLDEEFEAGDGESEAAAEAPAAESFAEESPPEGEPDRGEEPEAQEQEPSAEEPFEPGHTAPLRGRLQPAAAEPAGSGWFTEALAASRPLSSADIGTLSAVGIDPADGVAALRLLAGLVRALHRNQVLDLDTLAADIHAARPSGEAAQAPPEG